MNTFSYLFDINNFTINLKRIYRLAISQTISVPLMLSKQEWNTLMQSLRARAVAKGKCDKSAKGPQLALSNWVVLFFYSRFFRGGTPQLSLGLDVLDMFNSCAIFASIPFQFLPLLFLPLHAISIF